MCEENIYNCNKETTYISTTPLWCPLVVSDTSNM